MMRKLARTTSVFTLCSLSLTTAFIIISTSSKLSAQCPGPPGCHLCDVTATVSNVTNATIIEGVSDIGNTSGGSTATGTNIELEATGCGEISFDLELAFIWDQGSSVSWIHGVSFSASGGWSAASGVAPGVGWDFYNSVTGICSGNTYSDGYFYDECGVDDLSSYSNFWGFCFAVGGFDEITDCTDPSDNWGVDCETDCPTFEFELAFCPDQAGDFSETVTFFLTEDGESGGWGSGNNCNYTLDFPIIITAAGVQIPEEALGPDCPGTCYTLDAGDGCDGYSWDTGETTQSITVCPTEDTDYTVTVDISCGGDISGTYTIDVEDCCDAEAGMITATPDPACPGEEITVTISGYYDDPEYTEVYIIVGADGTIVETGPVTGDILFTPSDCGTYTFVSYNYLTSGTASDPMVGDVYADLDCDIDNHCCEAEEITLDVVDDEPPVITLPAAPTPACYQDWLDNFSPDDATFTDNCIADGTIVPVEITAMSPTVCEGGTLTFEYSITDDCDNTTTETLDIIIPALMVPDWLAPLPDAALDIECGDPIPDALDLDYDNGILSPCQLMGGPISPVISGDNPPDDCGDVLIRTWDATDECGNVLATQTQTITIVDTTNPTFDSAPASIEDLSCSDPLPDQEILTGSDNCGEPSITPSITFTEDVCNGYIVTHTWLIEDGCGNSDMTSIMFNVAPDATAPVFDSDPTSIEDVPCGGSLPMQETLTATDDCGTVTITTNQLFTEDVCAGYPVTYEWTAEDECGNTETVSVMFNVLGDAGAPVFDSAPAMIPDVLCGESLPVQETLTATDDCGTVTITTNQLFTEDVCAGYPVTYEWMAEDECGNIETVSVMFNVLADAGAPVFDTAPATIPDVLCGESLPVQETLTAADDCGTVTITTNQLFTEDVCSGYPVTYEWIAEDECGNSETVSIMFNVLGDAGPPVFDNPPASLADIDCSMALPPFENLSATDDCGSVSITTSMDNPVVDICNGYTINYTWTAEDDCGNIETISTPLNILADTEMPTLTVPDDITVSCSSIPSAGVATAMDNCSDASAITINYLGEVWIDNGLCDLSLERTWSATDECNNTTQEVQIIVVEPADPVWTSTLPADVTIECTPGFTEPVYVDLNYSNGEAIVECLEEGMVSPMENGTLVSCGDQKIITWEITSECGIVLTHMITVSLEDNTSPEWVILPPATESVDCLDDVPSSEDLEVMDNCADNEWVGYMDFIDATDCDGGTIVRTWTYTDPCGNGPISATKIYVVATPSSSACDDGDPCTEFDTGIIDCNGMVCECEGTPKPDISILGSLSFCTGSSTVLSTDASGNHVWSTGDMTSTITVSAAGMYSVTVTDVDGCMREASVEVVVDDVLSPTITGDLQVCPGETTSLDVGNGFSTYIWSTGGNTSTLTVGVGTYSVTVTDSGGCQGSSEVEVFEYPEPAVNILGELEICFGGNTVLFLDDSFDDQLWSNGLGNPQIVVNLPGIYGVTVTDDNGCTNTDEVEVVIGEDLIMAINGADFICEGGQTELDAGEWDEYAWSTGENTQSIIANLGGVYSVTVTDETGCTASSFIQINENNNPNPVISGSTAFCLGGFTILGLSESFENYLWSDGSGFPTFQTGIAGNYGVTVTDEFGCTGETSVDVSLEDGLQPSINGDLLICEDEMSLLDAGSNFDSYIWSEGSTSSTISVGPGNYSVTVSDVSGCTGTSMVSVVETPSPSVSIIGDLNICEGSSTVLDAGGGFASYVWSDGSSGTSLTTMTAGIYSVTVYDNNNCSAEDQVSVSLVNALDVFIMGDTDLCTGESTDLNAGSWASYIWNTGDNTQSINTAVMGNFSVTVTDENGCTGTSAVDVVLHELPMPIMTGSTSFCIGGFSELGVDDQYTSYVWDDQNGSTTETIQVSDAGTYNVSVTDAFGCTGSTSISITIDENLMPVITGGPGFCEGEMTTLNAGSGFAQYQWNDGTTDQFLAVNQAGVYSVTVTDASGICTGSDELSIEVYPNPDVIIFGDTELCMDELSALTVNGPYQDYAWSNGEVGESILVSEGNYSVTVSTQFDCIDSSDISINLNDDPFILVDDIDCSSDMLFYSIFIESNADLISTDLNNTINNSSQGFYEIQNVDINSSVTIFAEDSNSGCMSAIVVEPPSCDCTANADAGENQVIDCNNDIVALGGNTTSTGADYSYEWQDEDGNIVSTDADYSTDIPGIYTLIVTDLIQDCTDSDAVLVENLINEPTAIILADPDNIIDCVVDVVNLSNGMTESNVQYIWIVGNDTIYSNTLEVKDSMDVTLIAIDTITGCEQSDDIFIGSQVEYPLIDIDLPDTLNCLVDSIIIDASNSQQGASILYQWLDENGDEFANETGASYTTSEAGTYLLQLIDTLNGCVNTDTINVFSNIAIPDIDAGEEVNLACGEMNTSLQGFTDSVGDNFELHWSSQQGVILSGENELAPNVEGEGWYYLSIIDQSNGCENLDSVYVEVNSNIPQDFSSNSSNPLCFNDNNGSINVQLSAGGTEPFSYALNGETNQTGIFNNLPSGDYLINVIDALGCTHDTLISLQNPDSIFIDNPNITWELEAGSNLDIELITNVDPADILSIEWNPGLANGCTDCLQASWEDLQANQTYEITLTDQFGCQDTTTLVINIYENSTEIYIPNVISSTSSEPDNTFFPQTSDGAQLIETMEIYDRWGELMFINTNFMSNDPSLGWKGDFKGRDAVSGVYVYKIFWDGKKLAGDFTILR